MASFISSILKAFDIKFDIVSFTDYSTAIVHTFLMHEAGKVGNAVEVRIDLLMLLGLH